MTVGYIAKVNWKNGEKSGSYMEMTLESPLGQRFQCKVSKVKEKQNENAPDYELWKSIPTRGNQFPDLKVGALWLKESTGGVKYMAGHFESPVVPDGRVYISVFKFEDKTLDGKFPHIMYSVNWDSEAERRAYKNNNGSAGNQYDNSNDNNQSYAPQEAQQYQQPSNTQEQQKERSQMPDSNSIPVIDIDEDEIPF